MLTCMRASFIFSLRLALASNDVSCRLQTCAYELNNTAAFVYRQAVGSFLGRRRRTLELLADEAASRVEKAMRAALAGDMRLEIIDRQAWIEDKVEAGYAIDYSTMKVRGYPFRFTIHLSEAEVSAPATIDGVNDSDHDGSGDGLGGMGVRQFAEWRLQKYYY